MKNTLNTIVCTLASVFVFFSCKKTISSENEFKSLLSPLAGVRYFDEIFSDVDTSLFNLVYRVVNNFDKTDTLAMDVYVGANDTQTLRPAVIIIHGGAFEKPVQGEPPTNSSRKNTGLVELCKSFAKRGYVTMSISYRLGRNFQAGTTSDSIFKYAEAVYRAAQDARAALRFVKLHSIAGGIDSNKIFLFGGSAGAVTAMNIAYLDVVDIPEYYITRWGVLDGQGTYDYPGHSVKVKGLINSEGSITDTNYIDAGDPQIASLYGDQDILYTDSVARNSPPINFQNGQKIYARAFHLGINNSIKIYPGGIHGCTFDSINKSASTIFMRDKLFEWLNN